VSAKVPVVTHSSVTNLLIFHRYLEQNAHYRASMRMRPLPGAGSGPSTAPVNQQADSSTLPVDDDDVEDEDDDNISPVDPGWDLSFGPMTEEELMVGHVVKERLIKLLDFPSLKNHLLKRKSLLQLLVSPKTECFHGSEHRDGKVCMFYDIVELWLVTSIPFSMLVSSKSSKSERDASVVCD